jgi:hypothetical protein
VDTKVQGNLCFRVALYWLCCQLSVGLMLGCFLALKEQPASSTEWLYRIWTEYGQAMAASLLVLPLILIDCLVISSRFAGPMVCLRRAMKQLADGQPVSPVSFRTGDYWTEFAHEFNRILARTNGSEANKADAKSEQSNTVAADPEPETASLA